MEDAPDARRPRAAARRGRAPTSCSSRRARGAGTGRSAARGEAMRGDATSGRSRNAMHSSKTSSSARIDKTFARADADAEERGARRRAHFAARGGPAIAMASRSTASLALARVAPGSGRGRRREPRVVDRARSSSRRATTTTTTTTTTRGGGCRRRRGDAAARAATTTDATAEEEEEEEEEDEAYAFAAPAPSRLATTSRRRVLALSSSALVGWGSIAGSMGSLLLLPPPPASALVDAANAQRVFAVAAPGVVALADFTANGANGGYVPAGTGVLWSDRGYVVTNFHLVKRHLNGAADASEPSKPQRSQADKGKGAAVATTTLRVNVPVAVDGDPVWYDAEVIGTQARAIQKGVFHPSPGFNT